MIRFILALALALISSGAIAQSVPSNPAMTYGMVPTVGQWNNWFAQKQDTLGYIPVNRGGDAMQGPLTTQASTTSLAGFSVLPGVAPNVPVDGNVWMTSQGLYYQIGGIIVGPLGNGTIDGPGSSTAGDVATWGDATGTSLLDSGVSFASQSGNLVLATPSSGSGAPAFRALVGADLPTPQASALGGVESIAAVSHNFLTSIGTSGTPTQAQPAASDLSNGVTGTGSVVLATSPTLTTPALGTPSAVILTHGTGLPLTTGVTGTLPVGNGGTGSTTGAFIKINIVKFTTSGTYTPSTGLLYAVEECVGGGGGGGGIAGTSSLGGGGGGGGAGGYSRVTLSASSVGASQTVTIGSAGTGATTGNNSGGNGGQTSIGTACIAHGGQGGQGSGGSFGSTGGAGATVGTGDIAASGAPGGNPTGSSATGISGLGASSIFGGGGLSALAQSAAVVGSAGTGYGAGGSGGAAAATTSTAAGGSGAAGFAIITEYLSQ